METFKAVEKEMKTKAYSKEGLSAAAKLDPKEKEKQETCDFLSEMVDELDRQIETIEAEAESLQANMKKGKKDTGKADRISELERTAERHKWHQSKLELLRRALENGGVDTEDVKAIEESIKYYVENNQEVDFMEDDSIYDELNLDEEEDLYGMNNDADKVSSQDAQSIHNEEPPDTEGVGRSGSVSIAAKAKPTSTAEAPAAANRRPSVQLKSPLPALATLHTSLPANVNGAASIGMKPAPLPTISTGQPLKYASAAAAAAASDKSGLGIAPLPPPPGAAAPASQAPSRTSTTASPAAAPSQPAVVSQSPSQPPPPEPAKPTEAPSAIRHVAKSPVPAAAARETTQKAETPSHPSQATQTTAPIETSDKTQTGPSQDSRPDSLDSGVALTNGDVSKAQEEEDEESVYHLPSSLQDLLDSYNVTKRNVGSHVPDERLLTISRQTAPSPFDAEKPYHYKPQSPYPYTPTYYPQEPLAIFDDPRLYTRIDTDTLFYAFYYRQGTYQQYLAAKALKGQSWRFHKQYQTWFQRHEEPKNITEEYEQGTYRFFDYESTWYVFTSLLDFGLSLMFGNRMNRRKADFKFAYKFLEDDL